MSRRGVAAAVGKPKSTLCGWIERGLAYPDVEPYGSFAVDYQRAERGLEGAAAGTVTLIAQGVFRLAQRAAEGDLEALVALAKNDDLRGMLSVLAARWPQDWGSSKHREPERDFEGSHWLDAHSMDREQLGALFCDPPDAIKEALQDQAATVYRILLEGGFDPSAPKRKADEHEAGRPEADSEQGQMGAPGEDAVEPGHNEPG